ncbi:hypothetical protein, partial [Escherichia coli]|uniref:hypothetical protein n=1 Tax=Escherichia coli TaxID=562 RepID=UPI0032DB0B05
NGNNVHGTHKKQSEVGETSRKRKPNKQQSRAQVNQAGAASEHTLVMGDKSGATTVQVFESETEVAEDCLAGTEAIPEHLDDPPDSSQLDERGSTEQGWHDTSLGTSDVEEMEFEA